MRSRRVSEFLARRWVPVVATTALAGCVAAAVVGAVAWRGYAAQKTDLNDGGVWVTDSNEGLLGRENTPLKQLDLELQSPTRIGDRLDVLQSGEAVIAVDDNTDEVTPVDPTLGQANPHDAIPIKAADVDLDGDVIAVVDPAGQLWATHVDTVNGAGNLEALAAKSKPLDRVGPDSALTVSQAGTIYAGSEGTGTITAVGSSDAAFLAPITSRLQPTPAAPITQMTAVGGEPIWLDSDGEVGFSGHEVNVGHGAELQQPGPANGFVLVDAPTKLLAINLHSGAVRTLANVAAGIVAAAPVYLAGCARGLWSDGSTATVVAGCGGRRATDERFTVPPDSTLSYRVNRNAVFVNDLTNGEVWSADGAMVSRASSWRSLAPERQTSQKNQANVTHSGRQSPPHAVTDDLGARAGDTTVLHVLDNDRAPKGTLLSIDAIQNDNRQAEVQISPDRQTLLVRVAAGTAEQRLTFHYTIDDGEGANGTATGEVNLAVRADSGRGRPRLRTGYSTRTGPAYPVAAGESVDVPVLANWRDPTYGDPIEFVPGSAHAAKGVVAVTPSGGLQYTAPRGFSGTIPITYRVTTGGSAARGSALVRVDSGLRTAAPIAEPDVASGVVGAPITVHPLANDVPGADPNDPGAQLELAADVSSSPGLAVSTDLGAGTVTATASRPGAYLLPYRISYGAARGARTGEIKLVVQPATRTSNAPIATPATAAVYGTAPATVDVLADDYDPRGRLLAVTAAQPEDPGDGLSVAVIDGRWIRVWSRSGDLHPATQVIDYTVSNGHAQANSTLTVTQLPAISAAADAPDAEPDQAVVRAGDSVQIPVLDNDSTPSGDPVGLVTSQTAQPGELPLSTGSGHAYLDGDNVRFVAPRRVSGPTEATFVYPVENSADPQAPQSSGQVTVRIVPAPSDTMPDQAPTPPELDARVVEGGTVTLTLPSGNQDPDGDPVSITAIGGPSGRSSEPHLGQVLAYGAGSITYQAFAGQTGNDRFTYTLTDPYGKSATGVVRVAVVPPTAAQAPVAVNDTVTADPGRTLNVDVLANDLFPAGAVPRVEPLRDPPAGVSEHGGIIAVRPGPRGTRLVVPYTETNGLTSSSADLIVNFQKGFDNPPVAGSVVATHGRRPDVATANVLRQVSDIDDSRSQLRVVSVAGAPRGAVHGGTVTLPVGAEPRVWTYRVRDVEGAEAAGSIYVGASTVALPYLKSGSVLHLKAGATTTVPIARYVATPGRGTQPYLTTSSELADEPGSEFSGPVTAPTRQSLRVSTGERSGSADLVFQVTDARDQADKRTRTAMITLPVIIGRPAPQLTCPTTPIDIPESGTQTFEVSAVCSVWQDPTNVRHLTYAGALAAPVSGVSVHSSGNQIRIVADHAHAGQQGAIAVHAVGDAQAARVPFVVTQLPPPTMRSVPALQARAGEAISVNLAPYLSSDSVPAADFDPAIVSITPTNGGPAPSVKGTTATFTPPAGEHRTYTYRVELSDSGKGSGRPPAVGAVSLVVTDVPGTVTGVHAEASPQSGRVDLSWDSPESGGLPITKYVVRDQAGTTTCVTTSCTISGLTDGRAYRFTVVAYNSLGHSRRPSDAVTATPNSTPSAVGDLHVEDEGDGEVTFAWARPASGQVKSYLVTGAGGQYQTLGSQTLRDTVHGSNGASINFSIRAVGAGGVAMAGPLASTSGVPSGRPQAPGRPNVAGANVGVGASKAFTVSWGPVAPNGRGHTYYEVLVNHRPASCGGSTWTSSTTCTVDASNNGATYSYQVVAANAAGVPGQSEPADGPASSHQSSPSPVAVVSAAGRPDAIAVTLKPSGADGEATLAFTAGAANGASGTVTCIDGPITCSFTLGSHGGRGSKQITGLQDGHSYTLTLQYCNGADGDQARPSQGLDACVDSSAVTVVPFGPIGTPTISASDDGGTVTASAEVDPNGANVEMTVEDTDTHAHHSCAGGPTGGVICALREQDLNRGTVFHYTVTVTDASGNGRPARTAATSVRTAAAPAKTSKATPSPSTAAPTPTPAANTTTAPGQAAPAATPIGTPELTATANGNSVDLSASVDASGGAVDMTITDTVSGATHTCSSVTGSAAACSWTEAGLDYSTDYSFTLTVSDASGQARTSQTATASAKTGPTPIGAPALTATASANTVNLTATADGGDGTVSMTIKDTVDGATHTCAGLSGTSVSCSWSETGLNWATTYDYTLTVTDTSGEGRTSTSTTATAKTAPEPIGTPKLTATSNGQTISLTGTVDAGGGAVNITIKDTSTGVTSTESTNSCTGLTGTTATCSWAEKGLNWGTTYHYTMSVVDASGEGRASTSTTTSATTAPEPIGQPSLNANASGTTVNVSGAVDAGGGPVNMTITSSAGGSQTCNNVTGTNASCSWSQSGLAYSTGYTYTLTVTDASGEGRSTTSTQASATTGAAPPPSVSVTRGGSAPTSDCDGHTCYYIATTTANFSGTVSCHITASSYGLAGFVTWSQGANATSNGPDAQENDSVTVQCTFGSQTASGTGSW